MHSGSVVFYKIAATVLLIFVGYISRRMKLVPENSLMVMSKYVLNVAFPCYIIYYMPNTISRETLGSHWFYPLIGAALLCVSDIFGYGAARLWAKKEDIGTFRILAGLPNWVFMALAVSQPLFGETAVRVVLLYNVGITLYFWSFGMTSFRSGMGWGLVKNLFLNVQIVCTVIGIVLGLAFPFLKGMEKLTAEQLAALPISLGLITPIWETFYLLGLTTLPLSIIQIGLFLGAPRPADAPAAAKHERGALVLTSLIRLIAAPIVCIAALYALQLLGIGFSREEFVVSAIVMAMPAAVTCISVSEVFGGNSSLAARGILWTTVAGLATAPLLTHIAEAVYGWL